MTEDNGICRVSIHPTAIRAEDFIVYLRKLRVKFKKEPLAIFMDNLQVHRAKEVKRSFEELDMHPVWNVAYSPEFNPIEAVFSKVKREFCRQRLHCLVNKVGFNMDRQIELAFRLVDAEHCASCVRKSLHLLERAAHGN